MRALASLRCGPGSIPGPGVTCGLSLLFVLVPTPRVFLRVFWFSSLHKNPHSKFQFNPEMRATGLSALLLVSPSLVSHSLNNFKVNLFTCIYCIYLVRKNQSACMLAFTCTSRLPCHKIKFESNYTVETMQNGIKKIQFYRTLDLQNISLC